MVGGVGGDEKCVWFELTEVTKEDDRKGCTEPYRCFHSWIRVKERSEG